MSTAKQRAAAELRFRHAMANLVGNPDFKSFIDVIREQREIAIEDACTDRVISSERNTVTALGEVRAYKSIIAVYDEFLAQAADGTAPDLE